MASIFRVTTTWSGFNGAPGYTNHFFRNILPGGAPTGVDEALSAAAAGDRVHAFWTAIANLLPNDVSLKVEPIIDELDDGTGILIGSQSMASLAPVAGLQPGPYSAATGAVIMWSTNTIKNRRRIRGRTFVVPLSSVAFNVSGRIDAPNVQQIQDAAEDLAIGGLNSTFGVWARPILEDTDNGTVVDVPGQWAECVSVRATDLPAVLRSRRD